jgi:hypothetical protein
LPFFIPLLLLFLRGLKALFILKKDEGVIFNFCSCPHRKFFLRKNYTTLQEIRKELLGF